LSRAGATDVDRRWQRGPIPDPRKVSDPERDRLSVGASALSPRRRWSTGIWSSTGPALVAIVSAGVVGGCAAARPSTQSLALEPVLSPLPGEVELAHVSVAPRRGRIGVPGRDGAVERVIALDLSPTAAADLMQARYGTRYRFQRVDLGGLSPVSVELRGTAPTGARVVVTASTSPPAPLYGGLDELKPVPPGLATTMVLTVASIQ